ncbi:MAG: hypothetical protein JJU00_03140 [Opitutales bacterium]|nr:hypothetical protein [Opitutales bacterium]
MKRLNTRLESEGAEFLVLGQLLLHKIAAYKTYTNMPGYDLIATDPEHNTSARIQVKSRWRTGASGFPISNFDCEFVVAAFLNRGSKDGKKQVLSPDYYVFPVGVIRDLPRDKQWSKVDLKHLTDREIFRENWSQIADYLAALTAVSGKNTQGEQSAS